MTFLRYVKYCAVLALGFCLSPVLAQSLNPSAEAWQKAGGVNVALGRQHFDTGWQLDPASGLFWQSGEDQRKLKASHGEAEMQADTDIARGRFTIQGPGYLGLVERQKGHVETYLRSPETGQTIRVSSIWIQYMEKKPASAGQPAQWSGQWLDRASPRRIPANLTSLRWIPPGAPQTLEVHAVNRGAECTYEAGVEIEYEYWFFPLDGGKVVRIEDNASQTLATVGNDLEFCQMRLEDSAAQILALTAILENMQGLPAGPEQVDRVIVDRILERLDAPRTAPVTSDPEARMARLSDWIDFEQERHDRAAAECRTLADRLATLHQRAASQ